MCGAHGVCSSWQLRALKFAHAKVKPDSEVPMLLLKELGPFGTVVWRRVVLAVIALHMPVSLIAVVWRVGCAPTRAVTCTVAFPTRSA